MRHSFLPNYWFTINLWHIELYYCMQPAKWNIDMKENCRVKDIYHSLTTVLTGTIKQFGDFLPEIIKYVRVSYCKNWSSISKFEVNIMIWQGGSSEKILGVKGDDRWWIMDVSQLLLDPHTQLFPTEVDLKKFNSRDIFFLFPFLFIRYFSSQN